MLKSYEEMRKVDVTSYVKERDGANYLNWAKVVELLHENGAKTVFFEPIVNEHGSSLNMCDVEFKDKNGNTNRVYETAIKITIDDLVFIQRGPVTNGSNPVKDNSMTQQRLWNCQTRLFVKGVAIRTGLGFDLWIKEETKNALADEDILEKHKISSIKERVQIKYTQIMKKGFTVSDIARTLNKTEEEVKTIFSYYGILEKFEEDLEKILSNKK